MKLKEKRDEKKTTLFLNFWLNKMVWARLKSGRYYSGKVIEVADCGNGIVFLTILDKYNKHITFANSELDVLEEYKEGKNANRQQKNVA